jgi:uncharacterized membrane protein YfcA
VSDAAVIVALVVLGLLIGLTLGTLGAGGSILAVPVLVHIAGLSPSAATVTSLVAVGSAAIAAAIGHRRRVRLDIAAAFVPTGFIGAFVGVAIGARIDDTALLLGFSLLMLTAAARMMLTRPSVRPLSAAARVPTVGAPTTRASGGALGDLRAVVTVGLAGLGVGVLTGLFGVGGGFVIVPALTLAIGLAMPEAVATSLVVVAANAMIALAVRGPADVDWPIAAALTVPMLAGSLLGGRAARWLDPEQSRRAFAGLLVIVAIGNALAV